MAVRRTIRGFTLIELLAVIAIILILVAILVPLLGTVRERSQRMVCIGNMRSLQLAFNFCTMDREGQLPSSDTTSSYGTGTNDWWASSYDLTIGIVWPYIRDPKAYTCPTYPEPARTLLKRHYSLAVAIGSSASGPPLRSMSSIKRPAGTHIFIEEYDNRVAAQGPSPGAHDGFVVGLGGGLVDCPPYWHDMGANYTYLDGHAEYRKWVGPKMRTINCYTWFFSQMGMTLPGAPLDDDDFNYMRAGVMNAY